MVFPDVSEADVSVMSWLRWARVMLGKLDVLNAFLTYDIFNLQWVYSDINNKTSQFSSMAFYFHVLLLLKRFSKFQVVNISCVGYFFFLLWLDFISFYCYFIYVLLNLFRIDCDVKKYIIGISLSPTLSL